MSRIGKEPVELPDKVEVKIDGSSVTVSGPKGELSQDFNPELTIRQENGSLIVERPSDQRHHKALHGLTRALLANMVEGVSAGFRPNPWRYKGSAIKRPCKGTTCSCGWGTLMR